jgi:hypothetical protein
LLRRATKALGKSLLILTGVGYGVAKALDLLAEESRHDLPDPAPPPPDTKLQRMESIEERLNRIEKDLTQSENFVTRAEQNAAMEQLASRLEADIERRFEVQNRSVQSLRTMVARTDELLERVIESIESTSLTA